MEALWQSSRKASKFSIHNLISYVTSVHPPVGQDARNVTLPRHTQATGDKATAHQRYQQFLTLWKNADPDRPEVTTAKEFLAKEPAAAE